MNRYRLPMLLLAAVVAAVVPGDLLARQETPATGPEPMKLSLMDCIREAFKNNREVKVTSYYQELRENDLTFQEAQFDPSVTAATSYTDTSDPSLAYCDLSSFSAGLCSPLGSLKALSNMSSSAAAEGTYSDRLHLGSTWSADLAMVRQTRSFIILGFTPYPTDIPEYYYSQLTLSFTQPLLKNFGRKTNDTGIVIAANNRDASKENFRGIVQTILNNVEDAYWTLVYWRQDLEVRKEALRLAQELLKLNQIKVQVGTLPPIDIIQAEAGVASREEDVIIADSRIKTAEDQLRNVMGMEPQTPRWGATIVPTDEMTIAERAVDLSQEVKKAIENRTDLATTRLELKSADTTLAYRRNQLKYSLDFNARYILQGLAGDTRAISLWDPNTHSNITLAGPINSGMQDALEYIPKFEFPTWEVSLTVGIPIGNRAEEALYSSARLQKEQSSIMYQRQEQLAVVEVGNAVRQVLTDRKRIQAAEKNRILQEKKVEAEQKKFENGLSTSFQVLTFQSDLATARSAENLAKTDYRRSLATLDRATGTLDKALDIRIEDYRRE